LMPTRPGHGGKSIADIAHLYLSGAKNHPAADASAGGGAERPALRLANADDPTIGPDGVDVVAVVWDHLGPAAANGAHVYAEHLARVGKRVALLTVDAAGAALRVLHRTDEAPLHASAGAVDEALTDPEHLDCLVGVVDRLVLRVGGSASQHAAALADGAGSVCVLGGCDANALTLSYQAVKATVQRYPDKSVSIFLLDAVSVQEAEEAARKLTDLGERFLGRRLFCEGWSLRNGAVDSRMVQHCEATDGEWAQRWIEKLGRFVARSRSASNGSRPDGGVVAVASSGQEEGAAPSGDETTASGQAADEPPHSPAHADAASGNGVTALEPIDRPIASADDLYRFVCGRARGVEPGREDTVLNVARAREGQLARVVVTRGGLRIAVVAVCGDGGGAVQTAREALDWADQVLSQPPARARHLVVACTHGGVEAKLQAERAGLPARVIQVRHFSLGSRLGVLVDCWSCGALGVDPTFR